MNHSLRKGTAKNWPKEVLIHTDGASRGNPGPASLGLIVYDKKGVVIYEEAEALGKQTNNYAEYSAVLRALKLCCQNKVQTLTLKSDSEFLVKQLKGLYKVKSASIKKLYQECKSLADNIPSAEFHHVLREHNQPADALANLILDA